MRQSKYKLRKGPEDFLVSEVLDLTMDPNGQFTVLKLEKRDIDTLSALRLIAKELRIPVSDIGYCGLKDKHSMAAQYITVPRRAGLPDQIKQKSFSLSYVGETSRRLRLGDNPANEFMITLRELSGVVSAGITARIALFANAAIPNYFDSQRFTFHLNPPDDLVSHISKTDWEGGLKAYMFPFRKERRQIKDAKRAVLSHWGKWEDCLSITENAPSSIRKVVETLARTNGDFKKAVLSISKEDLDMSLAAHQSYLWNKALGEMVAKAVPPKDRMGVKYQAGQMLLYDVVRSQDLLSQFTGSQMGLADLKVEGPGEIPSHKVVPSDLSDLENAGIKPNTSSRPLAFRVKDAKLVEGGSDGSKNGNWVKVAFTVPHGAYATVVVKMMTGY